MSDARPQTCQTPLAERARALAAALVLLTGCGDPDPTGSEPRPSVVSDLPAAAPSCAEVPCAAPELVEPPASEDAANEARVLRGRVRDERGEPLSPARVLLVHARETDEPQFPHVVRVLHPWRPSAGGGRRLHGPLEVSVVAASGTNEEGELELREASDAAPDARFLVVEHGGRGRTIELTGTAAFDIVLPRTVTMSVLVPASVGSPTPALAVVSVFWSGLDGEERWSVNPLVPEGRDGDVERTVPLPFSAFGGRLATGTREHDPPEPVRAQLEIPVGEVRVSVQDGRTSNHASLTVAVGDAPAVVLPLRHPEAATLTLRLHEHADAAVPHFFRVWQHPEDSQDLALSESAVSRTLRHLAPGSYIIDVDSVTTGPCRQFVELAPNEVRDLTLDGRHCGSLVVGTP